MRNRELVQILKDNNEDGFFDIFIIAVQDKELDLVKALQDWLNQVGSKKFNIRTIDALLEDMIVLLEALDWIFDNPQYKTYFKENFSINRRKLLAEIKNHPIKIYKRVFLSENRNILFEKDPDIPKTNRKQDSNRTRKLKELQKVLNTSDLEEKGWTKKQINELKRYVYLRFNFSNMSRRYTNALKYLKDVRYKNVVDEIEKILDGATLQIDDDLLLNILWKSRTAQPSAQQLADKLKEKFADILAQYNINLDNIIKELKDSIPPTTYTNWDIDRRKQEAIPQWLLKLKSSIVSISKKISHYFSSLFKLSKDANSILRQLNNL
jgi:hypothetical protein